MRHQDDDSLETKYISGIVGRTVTISGTWTKIPAAFANYVFSTPTANSKKFRVLDIGPRTDLTYRIKGIEYDPDVYSDSVTVPPEAAPDGPEKGRQPHRHGGVEGDAGLGPVARIARVGRECDAVECLVSAHQPIGVEVAR